jgi:4-amino-4-deoxychorismate lyase
MDMNNWLINGVADDRISVVDRGFTYGDGLFETIAIRGGQMRFFDYHLDRLLDGAERLDIPAPGRELFNEEAIGLVTGCDHGTLKIILTRGSGQRGYTPPVPATPMRIIGLQPGVRPVQDKYTHGIVVRHCSTPIGRSPATAGLKTLGRLEQVLARAEWRDVSISEGLMSTADGFVICGTMSNLFLVQDGVLVVPDLSACGINGVMRRVVLDRARRIGLQWRVDDVPRDMLANADELFVTNSQIGLWPIRRIDDHDYLVGPVTRALMMELADAGVSECTAP